jgi:hypothetical protein
VSDNAQTSDPELREGCTSLLDQVETQLRASGHPVVHRLQPGLTDEEMNALTVPEGLLLGPELRAWFSWHNGVPPQPYLSDDDCLFPGMTAGSLQTVLADRSNFLDQARRDLLSGFNLEQLWPSRWIRLIAPQNTYAMVCQATGPTMTMYVEDRLTAAGPSVLWPSLSHFIRLWLASLEAEVLVPDPEGSWRINEDAPATQLLEQWLYL